MDTTTLTSARLGYLGESCVAAALTARRWNPCTPAIDEGFDFVAMRGRRACRVQVKCSLSVNRLSSAKFNLSKTKHNSDVHILLDLIRNVIYVMPTSHVARRGKHCIRLRPTSKYRDAYHYMLGAKKKTT